MTEPVKEEIMPQPPAEHYKGPGWEYMAKCGIYLRPDYVPQTGRIGGEIGEPQ